MTTEPSGSLLDSVAAFLNALATGPPPEKATDLLLDAFHETLQMTAAAVLVARPPQLIVFALTGFPIQQADNFESLPIDGDYPATRAFHESEIVVDPVSELAGTYRAMSSATSRGRLMIAAFPRAQLISAPIIGGGRTIGAYTAVCDTDRDWTTLDVAAFSTIGHGLGLWLTHPDSGLPDESASPVPLLSPRQSAILLRVAHGMTNASIAADLACSESTIRLELGRVLRALDASTRGEAAERAVALGLVDGGGG